MVKTTENKITLEREYIIPLRKAWLKVPKYERTRKAIQSIKKFIAKHMKVADRDLDKVKLDVYFNNQIWFRGRNKPPAKIKVKAQKEGEIVRVNFVDTPKYVLFNKAKIEKRHRKPTTEKVSEKPKDIEEQKTEEQKKEEKEKAQAVAHQHEEQAKLETKMQKHVPAKKSAPKIHRMALKK